MNNTIGELRPAEPQPPFEQAELPDWLLQKWVTVANAVGLSVGITLAVGDNLVSGWLIGGKEYFELLADYIEDGMAPHIRSGFTSFYQAIEELGTLYEKDFVEPAEVFGLDQLSSESDRDSPVYIHLKDARFFVAGSTPMGSKVLWRGRIAAVDGFCMGILEE